MCAISSILETGHRLLRQRANGMGTLSDRMATIQPTIKYLQIERKMTWEGVCSILSTTHNKFGLSYTRPGLRDTTHWWGTASPFWQFICGFTLRENELRVGHSNFTVRKTAGVESTVAVEAYGLSGAHHVLLEGISFPPEKKSSMAQSMGSMTAMIMLARHGSEERYGAKWRNAASRALAHFDGINSIIKATSGQKASDVKEVFRLIADILLVTTARNAIRGYMPAALLCSLFNDVDLGNIGNSVKIVEGKTVLEPVPNISTGDISWIDFSGKGLFTVYKKCMSKNFLYPKICSNNKASQIIFHSIFGTFSEDLGILDWMCTGTKFLTREELGDAFKGIGAATNTMEITLPKLRYYAKLRSACQTDYMGASQQQVSSMSRFSGFKDHNYTEFFRSYFQSNAETPGEIGRSLSEIRNNLIRRKEVLRQKINEKQVKKIGTVKWRKIDTLDWSSNEIGEEIDEIPPTSGRLFLSSSHELL